MNPILLIIYLIASIATIITLVILILKCRNKKCDHYSTGHGFDSQGRFPSVGSVGQPNKKIKNAPFLHTSRDLPSENKVTPQSLSYNEYSTPFNTLNPRKKPDNIYFPKSSREILHIVHEIVRGIKINKQKNGFYPDSLLKMVVRGGGHSYTNTSMCDGCQNVYLGKMTKVTPKSVEGGARLIHVYETFKDLGLMFPGGTCATVGMAGLCLGGGFGPLSRKYGFACDNVNAVEIITGNPDKLRYELLKIGRNSPGDKGRLFRSLMGAGHNIFGAITKFFIDPVPVPSLAVYFVALINPEFDTKEDFVDFWENAHAKFIELSDSKDPLFDTISFTLKMRPIDSSKRIQIQGQCIEKDREKSYRLINLFLKYIGVPKYFGNVQFVPITDYQDALQLWDGGPGYSFPSGQINTFYQTHPTFNHMSILIHSQKIDFGTLWEYFMSKNATDEAKRITGKEYWLYVLAMDIYPRKSLGSSNTLFKKFTSSYDIIGHVQYMSYLPSNQSDGSLIDSHANVLEIKRKIDYQTNIWENAIYNNLGKYQYLNYPSLYANKGPDTYFPREILRELAYLKKKFDPLEIFPNESVVGSLE